MKRKKTSSVIYTVIYFLLMIFVVEAKDDQTSEWNVRLEHARLMSYMKKYPESIKEYELLLKEKPDDLDLKIELAKVLHYDEQNEKALTILETIPDAKIDNEQRLIKAEIYTGMKEYGKAESIYRNSLQSDPNSEIVQLKLAELLSWQKQYDESLYLYQQLLSKRPEDIQLRRKYAMVLMWSGKHSQAASELEKTLPAK